MQALNIGFLILPGFPMACFTSAIEPLRSANEIAGKDVFSWSVISEQGHPVTASADVVFQPDMQLSDCIGPDFLFVLSSPHSEFSLPRTGYGALRRLARHGSKIGAVSGGIFPLARSGLLDQHCCSVHWCYRTAFQAEFPEVIACNELIVSDQNILTVSGAAAMFDLMLKLISDRLSPEIMTEVACWFQHPLVRDEDVVQNIPAFRGDNLAVDMPRSVARAIELFSANLQYPLSISEVANRAGVPPAICNVPLKRC